MNSKKVDTLIISSIICILCLIANCFYVWKVSSMSQSNKISAIALAIYVICFLIMSLIIYWEVL